MITAGLTLISAVSLTCLLFTTGWAGFVLAVIGFGALITLILIHREPSEPRGVSPYYDVSRLDLMDGVGTRKDQP